MPELPDAWVLSTGLRDDVVFTVASAYFAPTAAYQDGKTTMLQLIGFDEEGEPFTTKMSCGADWNSSDGGKTISHPTKKRINKNSIYGHWIQSCFEIPELIRVLVDRGEPTESAIWNTLILHLKQKEISFGRNLDPVSRLLPVEYLGIATESSGQVVGQTATITSAPTVAPTTPPAAPADTTPAPALSAADRVAAARAAKASPSTLTPLLEKVYELARGSNSHDEFMNKAFELTEVLVDDDLAQQVATEKAIWTIARST